MEKAIIPILIFFTMIACSSPEEQAQYKELGSMQAFAEMVAGDVKPLALSEPMSSEDVDKLWEEAQTIAKYNGIEVFREPNLVKTQLFPSELTENKEVLIFHKKEALNRYKDLKATIQSGKNGEAEARRFGRLLGYPPHYVNQLLAKKHGFQDFAGFWNSWHQPISLLQGPSKSQDLLQGYFRFGNHFRLWFCPYGKSHQ
jgi:hypothetical protein